MDERHRPAPAGARCAAPAHRQAPGATTLEQVITAAAARFSANGDVRRARLIRQVPGRLVPRVRRG
jgi:hypothetical protein